MRYGWLLPPSPRQWLPDGGGWLQVLPLQRLWHRRQRLPWARQAAPQGCRQVALRLPPLQPLLPQQHLLLLTLLARPARSIPSQHGEFSRLFSPSPASSLIAAPRRAIAAI